MKLRTIASIFACLTLLLSSGCAARYQDLLRDRDLEIRDLTGQVSNLRAEKDDLQRQRDSALGKLKSSQAQPASATKKDDLTRLKQTGDGLDVRYVDGKITIGIPNSIAFDAGSKVVKKGAEKTLRNLSRVLRDDYSGHRIYVEGHTDSDPIKKTKKIYRHNRHLSSERADAVATFMVRRCNFPESSIATVAFGPNKPLASGSSKSAKARNRRVEIVVGEQL